MSLELPYGGKRTTAGPWDEYYGPYADVAAAKAAIPQAVRYDGLTVQITGTGEYHWLAADLSDTGLVAKGGSGSLTNGNGTTANGSAVDLGGTLTEASTSLITASGKYFEFNSTPVTGGADFGVISIFNDGTNTNRRVTIGGGNYAGGQFVFSFGKSGTYGDGAIFYDARTVKTGIEYSADYSATYTTRSLVDKAYADTKLTDVMTTRGDLIYRNASNVTARLPIGTATHVLTSDGTDVSWAAPSGGGWALTGTSTLTGAVDIVGTSSNTLKHTFGSLGTTRADGAGLHLRNTTAAAAGAQQISPSIVWEGRGWKTNATAASQSVIFRADVLPVQGAANPTGTWELASEVNGGGKTTRLSVTSAGLTTTGDLTLSAGTLTISSTRIIFFNGGIGTIAADLNNQLAFRANASSTVHSNGYFRFYNTNGNYTATSGTQNIIENQTSFAPTSGTAVFNAFLGSGTINQTGGANGVVSMFALTPTYTAAGGDVYGFRYAPTVTSITGVHYSFSATSGLMALNASVAGSSSFRIPHGTAPSSPVDGDIWTTTAGLYVRINGATVGPLS
jgi:hypothetical protein